MPQGVPSRPTVAHYVYLSLMRKVHPAIKIVGGTFAALLLIGVAIPQLTVWDLVPVDPMLKRCAMSALYRQYDKPIERIAFLLGKSRITKAPDNSSAEMESFTLFRIPMGVLRGRPDERSGVFCDFRPGPSDVSGPVLPEPKAVPPGWYVHRMNERSLLITKQEKLPDIGGTEGYAYGEQVGVSLSMNGRTPQEWVEQQEWLDDEALVKAKTWTERNGRALLQVQHETEASGQLTSFLFVDDKVYTISLYPYPPGEGLDIVNALLDTYSN